jgi:HEAT repeat protein
MNSVIGHLNMRYVHELLLMLIICILSAANNISCITESKSESISEIINETDWSHDYGGQNISRIDNIISTEKGLNDFYNLLDSNDEFTVINTAVLIRLLAESGKLNSPPKSQVILALTRIISSDKSQYKAEAIMALNNITNGYIVSFAQDKLLEDKLTESDILLIEEIVNSLLIALNDDDNLIKSFSAQTLFPYGSYAMKAEPELAILLTSDNVGVRLSAAATIGYVNPNSSIEVVPIILEGIRNYKRNTLRLNAIKALVKIRDINQDVVNTLIYLIETGDNIVLEAATDALIEMQPNPNLIIPKLYLLLSSDDVDVRNAGVQLQAEFDDEDNFSL